ncbi:MAG: UDP-N-acetylmuramyl pentapeptide synthase, partial [Halieaceae bacterium]
NANPEAVKAAIDVLANTNGRRVLVLGAMGELGSESETLHAEVGRYASERDIEELWCVGPECLPAAQAFLGRVSSYSTLAVLIDALDENIEGVDVLLVKGSRSSGMDAVVAHFNSGGRY